MAKAKGLEPLAHYLLTYPASGVEAEAEKYINEEIKSVDEALQGARDIIAEIIADNADYQYNQELLKNCQIIWFFVVIF